MTLSRGKVVATPKARQLHPPLLIKEQVRGPKVAADQPLVMRAAERARDRDPQEMLKIQPARSFAEHPGAAEAGMQVSHARHDPSAFSRHHTEIWLNDGAGIDMSLGPACSRIAGRRAASPI